jgi:hypothetical protein
VAPRQLSKSRYLNGLQCLKYLWISVHEPDKIPEPDAATQSLFDQGHLVGELAKKLFPDGVNIPADDFMGNIRQTSEMLEQRRTVFEAGIMAGNIYSRIDILKPVNPSIDGKGEWDIIEVKSSTRIKDVDIQDVSFQKYCCQQAGLEIKNCYLVHINSQYVRHGEIDIEQLFIMDDISEQVESAVRVVPERVAEMLGIIAAERCPDVAIGRHCSNPYDCPVAGCREFLPADSVLDLYRGGQKSFELLNNGTLAIRDIPDSFNLTASQRIQRECVICGRPHADNERIAGFLDALEYPVYYLDFETIGTALPLFDGTRPYQNIPFQFSLRVDWGGIFKPQHFSFLAEGIEDPRTELVKALRSWIGDAGSIVVYNQSFEKSILEDLGQAFPEYDDWMRDKIGRIIDLIIPFRNFWYYHPAQTGSASLKAVLPALTGRGYEGLNIAGGKEASSAFLRVIHGDVSEEEKKRVLRDLREYCGRDTEGMIWIVEMLGRIRGGI